MARFMTRFARRDDGSVTLVSMYFLAGVLAVSALAVDFAYLLSARNQLQVAADAAAHAALYYRERHDGAEAKAKAVEIANHSMPEENYGAVLRVEDIEFGHWDYETQTFTVDDFSKDAVRVRPGRTNTRGNPVAAHLFSIINKPLWDMTAQAVFVVFDPHCLREGFVGDKVVDIQSNNGYKKGFCVHSNQYVSVNSNNTFEAGTVVSMPDSDDIDLPRSGFESNAGLQAALRNGYYRLRILNQMDQIYEDLYWASGDFVPDYIVSNVPVTVSTKKLTVDDLVPERVHRVNCGGQALQIEAGTVLSRVVVVTDCAVRFGAGVVLDEAVIITQSTDRKSINAASDLQIGRNDACADGGGAQIITYGGLDVPADLKFFGGQVIAQGDVSFSADAGGIEGASIIAGGTISGTSNMTMGYCGTGMDDNFTVPYFRLAF